MLFSMFVIGGTELFVMSMMIKRISRAIILNRLRWNGINSVIVDWLAVSPLLVNDLWDFLNILRLQGFMAAITLNGPIGT